MSEKDFNQLLEESQKIIDKLALKKVKPPDTKSLVENIHNNLIETINQISSPEAESNLSQLKLDNKLLPPGEAMKKLTNFIGVKEES